MTWYVVELGPTHRCKAAHRWWIHPLTEMSHRSCDTTTQKLLSATKLKAHTSQLDLRCTSVCQTHQQRATFLTVYPPPPRTNRGILKLFTNSTHSLFNTSNTYTWVNKRPSLNVNMSWAECSVCVHGRCIHCKQLHYYSVYKDNTFNITAIQ